MLSSLGLYANNCVLYTSNSSIELNIGPSKFSLHQWMRTETSVLQPHALPNLINSLIVNGREKLYGSVVFKSKISGICKF